MHEENNVIDLDKFNLNRENLIKSMADNMEYSSVEHPQIGIFWYDSDKQELFGVNKTDAEDVNFVHGYDGDIKQYKYLHKDIWAKEFRRNKDDRFVIGLKNIRKQNPRYYLNSIYLKQQPLLKIFIGILVMVGQMN